MLAECGALADLIAAGARILECACGPCIGMGQSPNSGGVSLRTFNRNFEGRSGTADASVYLVSPGDRRGLPPSPAYITDPPHPGRDARHRRCPTHFRINDNMVDAPAPAEEADSRGSPARAQHQALPPGRAPAGQHRAASACSRWATTSPPTTSCPPAPRSCPTAPTSPICPSSASPSATRTSPRAPRQQGRASSSAAPTTARALPASTRRWCRCIWASSAVIAKSFARIHAANLINAGILPLTLAKPEPTTTKISPGRSSLILDGLIARGHRSRRQARCSRTRPAAKNLRADC